MGFIRVDGLPGKVFIPDESASSCRKHPCRDCTHCQQCAESRCGLCRLNRGETDGWPPGGDAAGQS